MVVYPMPEPLPLPLRVLVKGASTVVWTSWMGGPRSDLAYPRVIEAELHAAGQPAEVRVTAKGSARTKDAIKTWEEEVVAWSPDVIVLHYGHFETVHLMLPSWMEHYANNRSRRPGAVRELYYGGVVKKAWKALATVQQFADQRVDPTIFAHRPRRVAADLECLITRVRSVASPLVIIPDLLQPGPPYAKWFPGMGPRIEVMNATLDALVARLDHRDIRRFPVAKLVAELDLDGEPTPDGGHYTPTVHRAVGEGLARVILEWAADQPHLSAHRRRGGALSAPSAPSPERADREGERVHAP